MIFPGMDPYLENPVFWPEVHNRLIMQLAEQLQPLVRPRYVVAVEARVFLQGPDREVVPDVSVVRRWPAARPAGPATLEADVPVEIEVPAIEVTETFLEILALDSPRRVVTVIEVVSPSNKYAGPGRELYVKKQQEVRATSAHLIEIDLLRLGPHVLSVPEAAARAAVTYDYLICVNRAAATRNRFALYPGRVRERLPRLGVPLAEREGDVVLDLQAALSRSYEVGAYDLRVDYTRPCAPPLSPEDQAWADELIAAARRAG